MRTQWFSDHTRHFSNWCDIYNSVTIRWQKWFMETTPALKPSRCTAIYTVTTALLANTLLTSPSKTHTHTHTCTRTHIHTLTHTHTHAHIYTHSHTHSLSLCCAYFLSFFLFPCFFRTGQTKQLVHLTNCWFDFFSLQYMLILTSKILEIAG